MADQFQEFVNRWTKRVEEIKKQKLKPKFCIEIYDDFVTEYLYAKAHISGNISVFERQKIANDVKFAIMIANTNYDSYMREKSWWYRLVSGKKEITLFKR